MKTDILLLPSDLGKTLRDAIAQEMPKGKGAIFGGMKIQTSPRIPEGIVVFVNREGSVVVVDLGEGSNTLGVSNA